MTEEEKKKSPFVFALNPQAQASGYPPLNFPTVYAEYVPFITLGSTVVKFYFMRADAPLIPNVGEDVPTNTPVCQVVMPLDSFVHTAVYFSAYLENLIASGIVQKEVVESMRAVFPAPTQNEDAKSDDA